VDYPIFHICDVFIIMMENSPISWLGYSEKSCLASIMSMNIEVEKHSTDDECECQSGFECEKVQIQDLKSFSEIHLFSRSISETHTTERLPESQPQCFSCTVF
jgi:hypothetical protein